MLRLTRCQMKFLPVLLMVITMSGFLHGQTPPTLGSTVTYGAFTGVGGVTNTGLTQIYGDIGTNAGQFTGFPPGQYTGAKHVEDPASLVAKNDLTTVWNQMGAIPCDATLSVTMGNGQILTPKTYCVGKASTIAGNLVLDAQGNPNAIFIIKVGGALDVAATSNITLINLAQAGNVYWRIDGAVSILDNSIFKGTIVANGAIHLYGGVALDGRALSVVGAITMASNRITVPVNTQTATLVVVRPALGDTVIGGTQNYRIEFIGVNITQLKGFEYSLDSGMTWIPIGVVRSDSSYYLWNVPATPSTRALVRITDSNGVMGTSGIFVIKSGSSVGSINSLSLLGPVNNRIGNGMPMQISWTYTPDIGTSVDVEYSLDSGNTWTWIATVPTNGLQSVTWTTPASGTYDAALIRVTSTLGMRRISDAFRIGTIAGIDDRGVAEGYAITMSPNPVAGIVTIGFTIPTGGPARIVVVDGLGREVGAVTSRNFSAGNHSIQFDASGLPSGVYTWTLTMANAGVNGRMTVVR